VGGKKSRCRENDVLGQKTEELEGEKEKPEEIKGGRVLFGL